MNRPSDDLFARYRDELVMDPEARARSFRKLQERVLRGEIPLHQTDLQPPAAPVSHGLWSLSAKWVAVLAGLGVGALVWFNADALRSPLTAAEQVGGAREPTALSTEERPVPEANVQTSARPPSLERAANSGRADSVLAGALERRSPADAPRAKARTSAQPSVAALPLRASADARPQGPGRRAAALEPRSAQGEAALHGSTASTPVGHARSAPAEDPQALAGAARIDQDRAGTVMRGDRLAQQPSATASLVPERSDRAIASATLTKEVQLLQAAQLALRGGDTGRALALLAEHTWTYPQGHLAEARDVARILALCQAGHVEQSQQHAKRFLQQRPESPFALRVRAGCAAMTSSVDTRPLPAPLGEPSR